MSVKGLERLDVLRKAQDFAVSIYREVLPLLPDEEKWGLTMQLRRAVQSVPANIAEGYGRYYFQENVRFCHIARGSMEETISHLSLAHQLGFLPDDLFKRLTHESDELNRLINGYIAYLKRSKQGADEPGSNLTLAEESADYLTLDPENQENPSAEDTYPENN